MIAITDCGTIADDVNAQQTSTSEPGRLERAQTPVILDRLRGMDLVFQNEGSLVPQFLIWLKW